MKIFTFPRDGMNSFILRLILIAAFAGMAMMAQAQTVQTDKGDYQPGEVAYITGSGFLAGETVTLQVLHVGEEGDNTTSPSGAHLPWNVVADPSGNISSSWQVPLDEDEKGATLLLTANGLSSNLYSEWYFTDAAKTFTGPGNFSDVSRWTGGGGGLPAAGDNITIKGSCVFDVSTNVLYGDFTLGQGNDSGTITWPAGSTNILNVVKLNSGTNTNGGNSLMNMSNGGVVNIRGQWNVG